METTKPIKRHSIDKLKDGAIKENLIIDIDKNITEKLPDIDSITDCNWKTIEETTKDCAETHLGMQGKKNRKNWFDEECREAIKEKNK